MGSPPLVPSVRHPSTVVCSNVYLQCLEDLMSVVRPLELIDVFETGLFCVVEIPVLQVVAYSAVIWGSLYR